MFDLDGTLIDSINVYYKVVQAVFKKLDLPPVSRTQIYAAVDDGQFKWERVLPAAMLTGKDDIILKGMTVARQVYPEIFRREVDFFQGVPELLAGIHAQGIKIGIVTATPGDNMVEKEVLLARDGVASCIDTIVTNDDAPLPKPAPDTVLECCRRLAVLPGQSLFVGDTSVDIRAGKAAGTMTAAVLTGFDSRETLYRDAPDVILDQVADLAGMIDSI
jgi:HAD superfamily hydrolase (TIGR01509 family)